MRIDGPIPFHVAQAYGVKRPTAPSVISPTQPPVSPSVEGVDASSGVKPSESLKQLIAGKVAQGVDFDSASTPARPSGPVLQLYNRAADKIEAATGVHLGRSLDLKG